MSSRLSAEESLVASGRERVKSVPACMPFISAGRDPVSGNKWHVHVAQAPIPAALVTLPSLLADRTEGKLIHAGILNQNVIKSSYINMAIFTHSCNIMHFINIKKKITKASNKISGNKIYKIKRV